MDERALADELAVRSLVARTCHAIVTRDDATWAQGWAEDGTWELLGKAVQGRDAILARYHALVGGARWVRQTLSDGVVEVAGDEARGRWLVTEHVQMADGGGLLNLGVYRDRYRRDADGCWRFLHRHFAATYIGPPDLSGAPIPLPDGF